MKPQEFEKIVRAKTPVVESAPEPIVEATPAPVLKSMDITSINQQYHALLGESSLRGFAPGKNGGGTEAYTMEDEELDGMALGELQAIAQAAKKIYRSVKQGIPLEAWMYKKITNGNEGLTAVAQQINNPAVREQPGVAEGLNDTQKKIEDTINKLEDRLKHAKSDEQWDRISARIERLQAGLKRSKQGVAEGLSQTLRKVVPGYAKREIDKKMDAGKFGKTDVDKDANYYRYKKIQDKLKEQGVAEGLTTRGGFGGSASQAYHEIEWLKKKIASLPPTKEKQIRDLQRQIRERELAIAFQKEGVAEGSLNEFAIDKEPNGDNRSKLIGTIVQLLKSGKKVDFYVPGIRGHVVGSGGNGDWLTLKRWNKPYSKINYSLELDASDDSRFSLKMIKPDYYQVVQSEDMNQGVAEGSISDLLNKDPTSPKFNDHSAPRKTKHSGSTPTPYEQGRLDAHRKKSYNNIHNSEQDAEDYKTGYRHVKSRQGVAEGSGGNWYIRVNGKILNDTKFKPMIFSSEDEARSYAMKLADKKRIPLSQIKLTKSWMDAPEQGVAEGLEDTQKKIEDTINKLEDRLKHAKSDEQWDRISARIERLQAGLKRSKQGVAEGLSQTLRKVVPGYAKREIDKKMDAGKFGKTDADKDANFQRYKKIQDKIKEKGVAEEKKDSRSASEKMSDYAVKRHKVYQGIANKQKELMKKWNDDHKDEPHLQVTIPEDVGSPMAAIKGVPVPESMAQKIKAMYKKKVVEDTYDSEKDDKYGQNPTFGKKPVMKSIDNKSDRNVDGVKTKAAAVLTGGTTLTGQKRDTVQIDPQLNNPRPGQTDPNGDRSNK